MLRGLLGLLSTAQLGARLKISAERLFRQAATLSVAAAIFLAALVFGLIAAYQALVVSFDFSPLEASTIMALTLLLLSILVAAAIPLMNSPPRRRAMVAPRPEVEYLTQGVGYVDQGVGAVMQQMGPLPLLSLAFVAGLLASRR
jgi:hypothetical protein